MNSNSDPQTYFTQKQLAERYGIKVSTVIKWRQRTREGKPYGPPWYDTKTPFRPHSIRIRYRLADVLAWEVSQGVHPIH